MHYSFILFLFHFGTLTMALSILWMREWMNFYEWKCIIYLKPISLIWIILVNIYSLLDRMIIFTDFDKNGPISFIWRGLSKSHFCTSLNTCSYFPLLYRVVRTSLLVYFSDVRHTCHFELSPYFVFFMVKTWSHRQVIWMFYVFVFVKHVLISFVTSRLQLCNFCDVHV